MKNAEEWSLAFDQLYNNITSNQAPGLNELEKSKFLTSAQRTVVIALYNGSAGKGFEETEELTDYLAPLVKQAVCQEASGDLPHITSGSVIFELPEDIMFRTYESCSINVDGCGTREAVVVPVSQDEFWRTNRNPFKGPNGNHVLRLAYSESDSDTLLSEQGYSEIVSKYPVESYLVRYISRPEPIVLEDLADGLTVDGESKEKTCKLPEPVHRLILEEAVRQAKAVWESR